MKIRVSPDRWQLIEELFHAALDHSAGGRAQFLVEACGDDAPLRAQVEALLIAHERSDGFIQQHGPATLVTALGDDRRLQQGTQVGAYRVLTLLAEGGMGEVYLAHDPKLGRKIALKLLPLRFTSNSELVRRFEIEARAASSLNHPNIVTVFDIGEDEGIHYIATEFIDGETLRARISRGKLDLQDAIDIAVQAASALAAGHEAGIIHRDIKPENIMVRKDGYVKVLDFGLAKLSEGFEAGLRTGDSLSLRTEPGIVMGTMSYMSPEQARGEEVDSRSDVFSLGVVLNEMVTGEGPFKRATPAATLDAILNYSPPPITEVNPDVPSQLERIVAKALAKSPSGRYQTTANMLGDLKQLRSEIGPTGGSFVKFGWPRRAAMFAIGAIAVAAIAVGTWYMLAGRSAGVVPGAPPFSGAISTRVTDQPGPEVFPSLSPDGKSLLYASNIGGDWDIYLQRVEGQKPTNLTTDSTDDDTEPAFSPDGERIAYRSSRNGGGIFLMGGTGENLRRVADFGHNPAWSPNGQEIVLAEDRVEDPASRANTPSKLWSVKVGSGECKLITDGDAVQPHWSPNGYRIAYWGLRSGGQRDVWTISSQGGEPIRVTGYRFFNWNPTWSPDGRYLYFASDRGGTMNLWRVSIDEQSGKVLGEPEPVTTPSGYSQHISFSRDGTRMAYVQVANKVNIQRVGFDSASGRVNSDRTWIKQGSRRTASLDISPDDQWLTFENHGETQEDLFVMRTDGTGLRQITNDAYRDRAPRWSPDGKNIAFYSDRSGKYEIWLIGLDGNDPRQLTFTAGGPSVYYPFWSPDSRRLMYGTQGEATTIIEVEAPWSEQSRQRLPRPGEANSRFGGWSWSPDGKRLAGRHATLAGDQTLGLLVYSLGTGEFKRLVDFGQRPVWLSDNRRLLFMYQQKLYLVDEKTRAITELLSVEPYRIQSFTASHDDRTIYLSIEVAEADVWVLTDASRRASD